MSIDAAMTLGDLVIQDSRRSRILDELDLDYCCNGHRTLADAVSSAGLDLAQVLDALTLPDASPADAPAVARDNSALAHEIVDTHHAFMWAEMPRLRDLVVKVNSVHGDGHPELAEVERTYLDAIAALDPHMTSEERVIFPAISRMEKTRAATPGSLAEPIELLREEHEVVGQMFHRIRALTGNYAAPEDACTSYRMMLDGLKNMELDLHEHIHLENNVLFPRVLELEEQLRST